MTGRLKVILIFGLVAIPATYFASNHSDDTTPEAADTAYQQQLAALRQKQEANLKAKATTEASNGSAASVANSTVPAYPSPVANQVTQHIQNTLNSLHNMIPGAGPKLPVANYDSNAQRLQYLQTMPITVIESTGKQDAQLMARQNAGRIDPFAEFPAGQPFPKASKPLEKLAGRKSVNDIGAGPEGLPPPPMSSSSPSLATELAPPPPPPGIELDELPPPPEKPMLSKNLKLNAIVGDHIILAFKDRNYQKKNHFKPFITLAQGQEFDTVTLVDIGKDEATIEENGRQITMRLDPIR